MCSPFKAIKKFFKKVVKSAKIIVPVVLGAAAIYFTVGAALGVTGTAGGWLSSSLGLSGTLGSVVSGAVTQAGYGALLGGGLAAVTDGDVGKGLLEGALAGAVTGGITGAITAPAIAASSGATGATGPGTTAGGGLPSELGLAGSLDTAAGLNPNTAIKAPTTGGPETTGLLTRFGEFASTPGGGAIIGGAIQGIGSGIGNFALADAEVEAAKLRAEQEEAERARIAANFDVSGGGGLLTGTRFDTTPRPTPLQQFNPATVLARSRGAMWRYNPATGQVELTPTA